MAQTLFASGAISTTLVSAPVNWAGLGANYNKPEVLALIMDAFVAFKNSPGFIAQTPFLRNRLSREIRVGSYKWQVRALKDQVTPASASSGSWTTAKDAIVVRGRAIADDTVLIDIVLAIPATVDLTSLDAITLS